MFYLIIDTAIHLRQSPSQEECIVAKAENNRVMLTIKHQNQPKNNNLEAYSRQETL